MKKMGILIALILPFLFTSCQYAIVKKHRVIHRKIGLLLYTDDQNGSVIFFPIKHPLEESSDSRKIFLSGSFGQGINMYRRDRKILEFIHIDSKRAILTNTDLKGCWPKLSVSIVRLSYYILESELKSMGKMRVSSMNCIIDSLKVPVEVTSLDVEVVSISGI